MIHGKKKTFKGTFYFKKPHFCPKCQTQMETITLKETVNSKSPTNKQHSFRLNYGTHLEGNVEFSWKELKCPNCDYQLTMEEMQMIESKDLPRKQSQKQERKEKLKVTVFTLGLITFALILVMILINK